MEETQKRTLKAAQGYTDLGMLEDARKNLDALTGSIRTTNDFLATELALLLKEKDWEAAAHSAGRLNERSPELTDPWIQHAYCLHELGRSLEAIDVLESGPDSLRSMPVYFYNMSCYHAQSGKLATARIMLDKCLDLDDSFLKSARTDPDLQPLLDSQHGAGLI